MNEELLPCPHCDKPVTCNYIGSSDWEFVCHNLYCGFQSLLTINAQVYGYGEGEKKEVRRRWNTRPSSWVPISPVETIE